MKLIPISEVRARRPSLQELAEIDDAITDALHGTTVYLESVFNTSFTRGVRKDIFFIDPRKQDSLNTFFNLRLRNGFVVSGTVSIRVASSMENIDSGDLLVKDRDYFIGDFDKGLILLNDFSTIENRLRFPVAGRFYQVEYDAGFTVDGMDTDLYTQAEVPEWLKELATVQSIVIVTTQMPIRRMEELDEVTKQLLNHSGLIVAEHDRRLNWALRPTVSK